MAKATPDGIGHAFTLLMTFLRLLPLLAVLAYGVLGMPAHAAPRNEWVMAKIDGRDYVSATSIKEFYAFTSLTRAGLRVTLETRKVEMILTIGSKECLMNNVKFVFSHPVLEQNGKVYVSRMDLAKLIDPVLRPNYIRNAGDFRTVILDPGHGGKDSGATNAIGKEATYNLEVARKAKLRLESAGFRVLMTRNRDEFLTLEQRVIFANNVRESAVFISIHFNSGASHARGIETFTLSPPGVAHYGRGVKPSDFFEQAGNTHDSANMALATSVHGSVLGRLGKHTFDRGIKRARFHVLSGVRHPAILLEGGFLTHSFESKLVASDVYQDALAAGIVEAVVRYRYAVGQKPGPRFTR